MNLTAAGYIVLTRIQMKIDKKYLGHIEMMMARRYMRNMTPAERLLVGIIVILSKIRTKSLICTQ